jgi:hypothetical protein
MTIDAEIFQKSRHHDAFSKNLRVRFARHARKSQRCLFVDESISIDAAIVLDRRNEREKDRKARL